MGAEKKELKTPDPRMLEQLDFLRNLEMMEMLVDTGVAQKIKQPANETKETKGGRK